MELQLDEHKVDEAIVNEHGIVDINKKSLSVNKRHEPRSSIILENVSQDTNGNYIELSFPPIPTMGLTPSASLIIISVPEGADVYLNESYKGKTPKRMDVEPKQYLIQLRLGGYESWETQYSIKSNQQKIEANMNKIQ